ncbi:MAG: C40 family peptidase [Armatimonadetes bacterium]|nr:C40 family peptidase [Armatimonadota bacterium]
MESRKRASGEAKERIAPPDSPIAPGALCRVRVSVADLWSRPVPGSERVSQVLLGTPLRVLAECGDYAYVESPDSYRGWTLQAETVPVASLDKPDHVISDLIVPAYPAPEASEPRLELYYGTRLTAGESAGERRQVLLPDGPAWVPATSLRRIDYEPLAPPSPCRRETTPEGAESDHPLDVEALLADAHRWVGVSYLWGGGTPRGVDCSGFVQVLFGVHGRRLLRDARLQVRHGISVAVTEVQAGDLLFFGRSRWNLPTHVGIAVGPESYIHAHDSEGHCVEVSPLAPALERWWGARRIW